MITTIVAYIIILRFLSKYIRLNKMNKRQQILEISAQKETNVQ